MKRGAGGGGGANQKLSDDTADNGCSSDFLFHLTAGDQWRNTKQQEKQKAVTNEQQIPFSPL